MGDGNTMQQLKSKNIICILELMILCDSEWNDEYKQEIYKLFDDIYSENVSFETQNELISSIKLWNNKSLYSMECIQTIFRERIRYLTNITKPKFSWEMLTDGHIRDKDLETFLKSKN